MAGKPYRDAPADVQDMEKSIKKHKRKKRLVILLVLILLALAAGGIWWGFQAKNITYQGNTHYSDEQMNQYIFGTGTPNTLLYRLFGNKSKTIPFVQKYDVEIQWPGTITVTVYEKSLVGYIHYMGSNMYFDKDGYVIESSSEILDGIPEIQGIQFNSIVLNEKLDVQNTSLFNNILDFTQAFSKYQMQVDRIYFDSSGSVTLTIGNVKVQMGTSENITEKLFQLSQLYDKLSGLKGTLHLEDYDGTSNTIIFKKEN